MKTEPITVAVTDDDLTSGFTDRLLKMEAFHREFEIPVSYFVVPCPPGKPSLSQDVELVKALKDAEAHGSEACAHSFEHNLFEWGYPEIEAAMGFSEPACNAFADARFAIEKYHEREPMRQRLQHVKKEWQDAMGSAPRGFRSGWGSFSHTLYELLAEEGFEWSSLRFASRTPWKWCRIGHGGDRDYPVCINEAVGLAPYRQCGVVEFPILGDFGFSAAGDMRERLIDLFKTLFALCVEQRVPCVICHHHHGLDAGGTDTGYDIYHEIFTWLRESDRARFVTMSQLHEEWKDKAGEPPPQEMPRMG